MLAALLQASILWSAFRFGPPKSSLRLEVRSAQDLHPQWDIEQGGFAENGINTWLTLKVRNTGERPVENGFFYVELFDASDRFCFSTIFTLQKNDEGETGPLAEGAVRTLYSVAANLARAVRPMQMRVYQAHKAQVGGLSKYAADVPIRTPSTVLATSRRPYPDWHTFWLASLHHNFKVPVLDLAFATIELDSTGNIMSVRVTDVSSAELYPWAETFVRHLHFRPSTIGSLPQHGQVPVLIRAALRAWRTEDPVYDAPTSKWVENYVKGRNDKEVPAINVLELGPCYLGPDGRLQSVGFSESSVMPDCIWYEGGGTDWLVGSPIK